LSLCVLFSLNLNDIISALTLTRNGKFKFYRLKYEFQTVGKKRRGARREIPNAFAAASRESFVWDSDSLARQMKPSRKGEETSRLSRNGRSATRRTNGGVPFSLVFVPRAPEPHSYPLLELGAYSSAATHPVVPGHDDRIQIRLYGGLFFYFESRAAVVHRA